MKRKKRFPLPYPKPNVAFASYVRFRRLPPASFPPWTQAMIFYVHAAIGKPFLHHMVSPVSNNYPIAFLFLEPL